MDKVLLTLLVRDYFGPEFRDPEFGILQTDLSFQNSTQLLDHDLSVCLL